MARAVTGRLTLNTKPLRAARGEIDLAFRTLVGRAIQRSARRISGVLIARQGKLVVGAPSAYPASVGAKYELRGLHGR